MQQLMPQGTHHSGASGQAITEQVNAAFPATGYPVISGSIPKDAALTVADQHGGLMSKLREAFFDFLRNRAL
jgi:hypothetical protein